jgi:hypothetical protein
MQKVNGTGQNEIIYRLQETTGSYVALCVLPRLTA